MKKFFLFLLVLTTLFSSLLTACGPATPQTPPATDNPETSLPPVTEPPETDPPLEPLAPEELSTVEAMLESKHKLTFNEDGSFRVLILADIHMDHKAETDKIEKTIMKLEYLVETADPNLVIFTGDNTIGAKSSFNLKKSITAITAYLEEHEIPWCHVYGNHDAEEGFSNENQQAAYESYAYCVSKAGPEEISGVGNYVLGVYNRDGSLGAAIYLLDSGAGTTGNYEYIRDDQIAWYKETSELLERYNGKTVPAMMAFHIPLKENNYAWENRENKELVYEYTGGTLEAINSSNTDTNLFETVLERGDVKAIATGHDHINDYMLNYLGVKLCACPGFSSLTYRDGNVDGGRVFDLNLATIDNIPTSIYYIKDMP